MLTKAAFFEKMEEQGLALAYKDVRLRTGYSKVKPTDVNVKTFFSRRVPLHCPIVSSAMDDVTEHKMAIAMAKAGGLGIIHRKLAPKLQAEEVRRVKLHMNARVENPVCVNENETIEHIENRRRQERYDFQTFPVLASDGKLIGLLTKSDFEMCAHRGLSAREAMTPTPMTARENTTIDEAYAFMVNNRKKVLPLINDQGAITGMYIFRDVRRVKFGDSSNQNIDANGHLRVGAAVGTGEEAVDRAGILIEAGVDVIVIDTAHADTSFVKKTLEALKAKYPNIDIVVGNVSEENSAKRLAEWGADGIKVGQGPGSICTTRLVAGVGCPQFTAIYQCTKGVEGYNIPVCADGGIEFSGDIPLAIVAGAHSVMIGGLLAGTDEAPGDEITLKGVRYKSYRGMGSLGAMLESKESQARYGQEGIGTDKLVPEGVEGAVPARGPANNVIYQLIGGLRSGMGYTGCETIEELREKANVMRITAQGFAESRPHNITILKEAPNYSEAAQGGNSDKQHS